MVYIFSALIFGRGHDRERLRARRFLSKVVLLGILRDLPVSVQTDFHRQGAGSSEHGAGSMEPEVGDQQTIVIRRETQRARRYEQ